MKNHDPIDVLGAVYEKMYESIARNYIKSEEKSNELLHKLIDESTEKFSELSEASKEDIEKISDYLKRDINDAAVYLGETGKEFSDWLGFESTLLEAEVSDLMLSMADPTTVALAELKINAKLASGYHVGEIIGAGTLVCDECGEKIVFYRAAEIMPCPKCSASHFHRFVEGDENSG